MMYPNATESKLAEIRQLWVEQIQLKNQRIAETSNSILTFDPSRVTAQASLNPASTMSTTYRMSTYLWKEEISGGTVTDGAHMTGSQDYSYTRFYTPSLNQGASVAGELSSTHSKGDVYVVGKLGPTGAGHTGNYLIVYGSNSTTDWTWVPIGYSQIGTYDSYYYVGNTGSGRVYRYISVGANTMMGSMDVYNDIYGDSVYLTY
jgi:hypothetical protein